MSGLPSYALVLSLEFGVDGDGPAPMLEQRLAALEAEQLRGHSFLAYTDLSGSEQTVYVLAPLESPAETGQGRGRSPYSPMGPTLQTSVESLKHARGFIAAHIPELSSAAPGRRLETALYVRLISAVMKPGLAEEARAAAWEAGRKIAAAHRQSAEGRSFVAYRSYSGVEEMVHVAVALDTVDGLDEWTANRKLLQEVYGADEAASLMEAVAQAVARSTSSVVKRHPSN